jgi:iron uptake system EfeUOB component EfeO/EfeM
LLTCTDPSTPTIERVPVRHSSIPTTRKASSGLAGLALVALLGLASCGSDAESSVTTAAASGGTLAPEDNKVAPAVVTAGLTKLPATIAAAIASIGTPEAEAKVDEIEAEWATFEGTVRDTDPDIYLAIEDQLDPVQDQIKAGETAKATATATTLADLFTQYLSKHPG